MARIIITILDGEQDEDVNGEQYVESILFPYTVTAEVYAWLDENGVGDGRGVWALFTPADEDPGPVTNVIDQGTFDL